MGHARICGSRGWATARGYPARFAKRGRGAGQASACFAGLVGSRKANASQGAQAYP